MRRFPFQNPVDESWQADADTVIYGDDLLEEVRPSEDDVDTLVYNEKVRHFSSSDWDDQAIEYMNSDVLEPAEPSAPSFSRPTLDAPILSRPATEDPTAAATAYFRTNTDESPLRRSSIPPPPLPPIDRSIPPPARAEMPTPVMEIMPTLEAIRPESRPPLDPYQSHDVYIPPSAPVPQYHDAAPMARSVPPPLPRRSSRTAPRAPHLDTLRPYSSSTNATPSAFAQSAAPSQSPPSQWPPSSHHPASEWPVSGSWFDEVPWIQSARGKLAGAFAFTSGAFSEVFDWAREMWSEVASSHQGEAASRLTRRLTAAVRPAFSIISAGVAALPWRGALGALGVVLNPRTATWALGGVFLFLAVVAIRNPGSSEESSSAIAASAASPGSPSSTPLLLDVDMIESTADVALEPEAIEDEVAEEKTQGDTTAEAEETESDEILDRVRSGDPKAVAELEARPPTSLSLDEVEALALGQEELARTETTRIISEIAQKRKISESDRATFLRHVGNQRTYREALLAMAENKSWQGPDLIYLAMRRYRSHKDIVSFAHALLLTGPIYKYASPALTVVIDAETIPKQATSSFECQQVRNLSERAYEDGDNRALLHMARFAETTGCGEHGQDDCFPCLREDNLLVDALRSAKGRRPPF